MVGSTISPLLKTITEGELEHIAALDYGQDTAEHLAALRQVIFQQDGNLTDDQYWCPHEVISLGTHVLHAGHEREFFFCTMLLLQAVLSGYDDSVDTWEKFDACTGDYDRLPPELRAEVLRAYQLVETMADSGTNDHRRAP